jgi:RNA polymerase sigma-70 factor (ECF subfamily)
MGNQQPMEQSVSLLKRLQAGEPSAAGELVRYYGPRLKAFLRCLVHSEELAEDLTQETFIRVCRKCGQVRLPEKFDTWLFALARNIAYKEVSLKRNQMEVPQDTSWFDTLEGSRGVHPMKALSAEEAGRLLNEALAILDAKWREIMAMRYYSGLSLQQISEVMNIPLGSIGTTISRSLTALKKYFDAKGLKVEDIL